MKRRLRKASSLGHTGKRQRNEEREDGVRSAKCVVCQDRYFFPTALSTSVGKLNESKENGCPTCTLICEGISEFFKSLPEEMLSTFALSGVEKIEISSSRWKSLSIRLECNTPHPGFELDFFTLHDESASPLLKTAQEYPYALDLDQSTKLIKKWIIECSLHGRKSCQIPVYSRLPTRVLDLGDPATSSEVKLLVTNGQIAPYICLSYCWGHDENPIKTIKANLLSHTKEIPLATFPRTFKDAISLTKALSIRYLWIDSLCILQDSDDLRDWEVESANMANVYSNSYLTIAATAGASPHKGLFFQRWTKANNVHKTTGNTQHIPLRDIDISSQRHPGAFVRPRIHLGHKRFMESDNAMHHIEDAPLLSRAWTYQERLLPARTVHFHAEELIWECKTTVYCECTWLNDHECQHEQNTEWLKVSMSLDSDATFESHATAWLDAVSEYSVLEITKSSDRIPALSGLTEAFSTFSGHVLGDYLAGIWRNDLARGLLFERVEANRTGPITQLEDSSTAADLRKRLPSPPSWSWTSIVLDSSGAPSFDSVLDNGFIQDNRHFDILDVQCPPSTPTNPFGSCSSGLLKVKAKIIHGVFRHSETSPGRIVEVQVRRNQCSRATFLSDNHDVLNDNTGLVCLLVGYSTKTPRGSTLQYALILKESEERRGCHERVGKLQIERSRRWFSKASVEEVTIV